MPQIVYYSCVVTIFLISASISLARSVRLISRWSRARRGSCVRCGYPRPLEGAPCSECGSRPSRDRLTGRYTAVAWACTAFVMITLVLSGPDWFWRICPTSGLLWVMSYDSVPGRSTSLELIARLEHQSLTRSDLQKVDQLARKWFRSSNTKCRATAARMFVVVLLDGEADAKSMILQCPSDVASAVTVAAIDEAVVCGYSHRWSHESIDEVLDMLSPAAATPFRGAPQSMREKLNTSNLATGTAKEHEPVRFPGGGQ